VDTSRLHFLNGFAEVAEHSRKRGDIGFELWALRHLEHMLTRTERQRARA
jgi:hypothetical protein